MENLPNDGDKVLYYFEPFETWYIGYVMESDYIEEGINYGSFLSVYGSSGFTTWNPEVTKWMPYSIDNVVKIVNSPESYSKHLKETYDALWG